MNPYKLREVYKQLTSQNSILKKYLKLGTKDIKQPDLPAFVEQKNAVNRFVRDNPRPDQIDRKDMAGGGRIGFYKGMRADKAKKKIKLKEPVTLTGKAGDRKLTAKQIDALDPNYLGDFTGGDLERPKKVYKSGTPNSVIDDAIEIRNIIVNNKGNIFGLEELGEKAQIYTSGTGTRKSGKGNRPDIRRVRAALALAKDSFPEIANFKFVTDRYKIDGSQRQQLNMVVDTIKAYQSATGDEKLAQFLPDNMGQFYTRVIEKGPKKLPGKPEQGLYIKMYNFGPEQIKYISDRITDETGQKFTSKDYKNLITDVKKYRASVSGDARIQTRLANINKQIKNLAEDSVIQNLLKGDLNRKTQEALLERATRLVGGDASIASRRLFMMAEAMSDTTNKYKNLGIELNNEKANKIIATGKEIGGRNNRYGMSSVLYDYYGNVVDKAIGSGEGQTFIGKYQQAIRNALDKGQSPDEIFSLTASARTRVPGQGNLAPYAIFTQRLKTDVNSAIKGAYIDSALSRTHGKLQEIFKGRKYSELNAAEKKAANALVEAFEKEKIRALNQPVNPGEVNKGAKPIYLTAAEKKNIQLPSFDLKNPPSKSIEGFATRFVEYPQIKEAFEKSYKDVGYSMKVSKDMLTQKELLAKIGCPNKVVKKASGGRVGYQDGTDICPTKGAQMINSGMKNASPAQLKNFALFANRARALGSAVMKFGVIPEAMYVAADATIRLTMGDKPTEALLRASEYLLPGDQTKLAEMMEAKRLMNPEAAAIIGRSIDYKNQLAKIQSLEDQISNLDNLSDVEEFGYMGDLTGEINTKKNLLSQAKNDLNNKFKMTDAEQTYADAMQDEIDDRRKSKSLLTKLKSMFRDVDPDSDVETLAAPEKTQEQLNLKMADQLPRDLLLAPESELLGYAKYQQSQGFDIPDDYYIKQQQNVKNMSLAELAAATSPEQVYGAQGYIAEPLFKGEVKKTPNVIGDMEREITGQTNVANPFDIDLSMMGSGLRGFSAAGGGIAKEAGDPSGPPPESGPNPQGLSYLMKRGKNI